MVESESESESDAADAAEASVFALRRDRFTLLLASGAIIGLFAIGASVQAATIYELGIKTTYSSDVVVNSLFPRTVANTAAVLTTVALIRLLAPERRRSLRFVASCLAVCLGGAAVRAAIQVAFQIYPPDRATFVLVDFVVAVAVIGIGLVVGLVFVASERRLRTQELANLSQRMRASAALAALQSEEVRVRREVAAGLHGTLQQSMVLMGARLVELSARLRRADSETVDACIGAVADELNDLVAEVDRLREVDVRELSQLLYPSGVEFGVAQGARMMLRRLPASIETHVTVEDGVRMLEAPEEAPQSTEVVTRRLMLLRVLEEAISNALKHGHASSLHVGLAVDARGRLELTVDDDGSGLAQPKPALHGLGLLRERIEVLGGSVSLANGPLGGVRIVAALAQGPVAS